ncbi:MAG: DUF1015 family protein [Lachnospiraceae bacterium]|nr:DUF1015 family protein [Lachnospiraceae bacterium]
MATFRPFPAVRPVKELVSEVAALPYDVMSSEEARKMAKDNPYSFLHVDKAEIDLDPSVDLYDPCVYEKAASNLKRMIEDGVYLKEEKPCFYIYRQIMDGRSQTGIVGCASIDDYRNNVIKKHELTRADKEEDRVHHVDVCDANTGPIFLTYRNKSAITDITKKWIRFHEALYDFTTDDGIRHTVWRMDDETINEELKALFERIPAFYIADGHHRAASAVRVGEKRRKENPDYTGEEEFNYFLSVLFPDEELSIWDYNRVLKEWNGHTPETLLAELSNCFDVRKWEKGMCKPKERHTFGLYMDKQWYLLKAKEGTFDSEHPVDRLDVSILQKQVLTPVFGIEDPRTDDRILFIGGIRGLEELVRLVDEEGMSAAFAMYPTGIDDLMEIADGGSIMPPKSTWFEPKLRSGIFIHQLK